MNDLLANGQIGLEGRVPWSSNYTFLVTVRQGEREALAIYKPVRGEQPLWDFPSRTLCRREVAAYHLSRALGWPAIPPVVLRKGPYGLGSVQLYVEADLEEHYFTLRGRPEHDEALRRIALYDVLANNADRKGGHVLKGVAGQIWAIDHGLTFHAEYKLRTVIWEYAGQPIPDAWLRELASLREALSSAESPLGAALSPYVAPEEFAALRQRLEGLLRSGIFSLPRENWRNVPYPLV